MTMPHLMNCSHSEEGWCLSCVKELWEERRCDMRPCVEEFARLMECSLRNNYAKATLSRSTSSKCWSAIQKHLCYLQEYDRALLESDSVRDREDLMEQMKRRSADLAIWLMVLMCWDVNRE